jgi:hypothetical protein
MSAVVTSVPFARRSTRFLALLVPVALASTGALAQSCVDVTTYHNDNSRQGQNPFEQYLTGGPTGSVATSLTRLFATAPAVTLNSWPVAQPLYLADTPIAGSSTNHDAVFVATLANSLYAFDADDGTLLWRHQRYGSPDVPDKVPFKYVQGGHTGCSDSGFGSGRNPSAGAGIVGTPVIDKSQSPPVMFFITKEIDPSQVHWLYLRAVDTSSGTELAHIPIPTAPPFSSVPFPSATQMSRPGMLQLSNGALIVAFGSVGCKQVPNSGWVMSFTYNPGPPASFTQTGTFNTTPDLGTYANGGIWQGNGGLVADADDNIYFETADANNGKLQGADFGDSVVKLSYNYTNAQTNALALADFFTPFNDAGLNTTDLDLSSVGPILLPDGIGGDSLLVASGKAEEVYVIDKDAMGGYCKGCTTNLNIVQDIPYPSDPRLACNTGGVVFTACTKARATCSYGPPSFWTGSWNGTIGTSYIYVASHPGPFYAYAVDGTLSKPVSSCPIVAPPPVPITAHVGSPSISSDNANNGIVWVISYTDTTATLWALDAATLTRLNSVKLPESVAHFPTPTVANGRVYVATQKELIAYSVPGVSSCVLPKTH